MPGPPSEPGSYSRMLWQPSTGAPMETLTTSPQVEGPNNEPDRDRTDHRLSRPYLLRGCRQPGHRRGDPRGDRGRLPGRYGALARRAGRASSQAHVPGRLRAIGIRQTGALADAESSGTLGTDPPRDRRRSHRPFGERPLAGTEAAPRYRVPAPLPGAVDAQLGLLVVGDAGGFRQSEDGFTGDVGEARALATCQQRDDLPTHARFPEFMQMVGGGRDRIGLGLGTEEGGDLVRHVD